MKKILSFVLLSAALTVCGFNKLPINPAESIIELPIGGWKCQTLTPGTTFKGAFSRTTMSATAQCKVKASAQMSLKFKNIDCNGYDKVVLFIRQPFMKQSITLKVETDKGISKRTMAPPDKRGSYYGEVIADITGAKFIKGISIIFTAGKTGRGMWQTYPRFIALQNSRQFADYQQYFERMRAVDWNEYLNSSVSFKDSAHLTFAPGELEKYRKDPGVVDYWKKRIVEISKRAEDFCVSLNEVLVHPVLLRPYMKGKMMYSQGYDLAIGAVICKDKKALQLAARCCLVAAAYKSWLEDYFSREWRFNGFPPFQPAYKAMHYAPAISLAAGAMTRKGREYALYGLLDKGYKEALHSLWARPAFGGNQAAVFLMAKVMPLLLFEKFWPRVKPYTEIAMDELREGMDTIFRTDGGYLESMGYFDYTISCVIPSYMAYSAARNLPLSKVIPENIKKSTKFAEIVYSTSKNPQRNVVSFGQTVNLSFSVPQRTLFMAAACPDTIYERFVDLKKTGNTKSDPLLWRLRRQVKLTGKYPELTTFVEVPSIGSVNSYRKTASGGISKVMFMGFAPMGKRDEDIGKFIIEYNGDAFADAMTARLAPYYGTAEFQNLLIPTGSGKVFHPIKYTTLKREHKKFIPKASGDEKSFKASIGNLAQSFDGKYFKKWSRSIDSPNPESVTITDDYELGSAATGVDFTWITTLAAEVKGNKIVISGDYGNVCELSWNSPCKASVERFSPSAAVYKGMFIDKKRKFSRIKIHRNGKNGQIIVKAKFISKTK